MIQQKYLQKLRDKLRTYVDFTDEELDEVEKYVEKVTFKKGTLLVEDKKISEYLYFILSGGIRLYKIGDDHKELTTYFVFEDEFFSGSSSFLTRQPYNGNIATVEKFTALRIHRDDVFKLFDKYHNFERLGRLIVEDTFIDFMKKGININNSAEQNYLELLQTRPELVKRLPIKYLASFIGVHPNTLSRIRKNIKF